MVTILTSPDDLKRFACIKCPQTSIGMGWDRLSPQQEGRKEGMKELMSWGSRRLCLPSPTLRCAKGRLRNFVCLNMSFWQGGGGPNQSKTVEGAHRYTGVNA